MVIGGIMGICSIDEAVLKRFWSKVDIRSGNECWNWTGCTTESGYGYFSLNGKSIYTHRLSYKISCGEIPEGLVVRHNCDNRKCCNPNHLLIGTFKDNSQDAKNRGRFHWQRFAPVKQIRPRRIWKLSDREINDILFDRKSGMKLKEIADKWFVSESMVSRIINGERREIVSGIDQTKKRKQKRLSVQEVLEIVKRDKMGSKKIDLAREFNVSYFTIYNVVTGRVHNQITGIS